MTILPPNQALIDAFFSDTKMLHGGNSNVNLSYLAVKKGTSFYLVQAVLSYDTTPSNTPKTHFRSTNIMAGSYSLSELSFTPEELVEQLLSGRLQMPDGKHVLFPANENGDFAANYEPFHEASTKAQARYAALLIFGDSQVPYMDRLSLDWEVRAASTPYDGIQEFLAHYAIGTLRGIVSVELIAFHVIALDYNSKVSASQADLAVFLMNGLNTNKATLGYRLFCQGKVETRSIIGGHEMEWTHTTNHQYGHKQITVPNSSGYTMLCKLRRHRTTFRLGSRPESGSKSKACGVQPIR